LTAFRRLSVGMEPFATGDVLTRQLHSLNVCCWEQRWAAVGRQRRFAEGV